MARFLSPYIQNETSSTVVIKNVSSAGGLTSINQFVSQKANSLDIIYINTQTAFLSQIFKMPNVNYDLKSISFLGKISSDPYVLLVNPNLPYKTFDEFINSKSTIKWASSGKTTGSSTNAAILSEIFQLNSKIIMGYKGSNETALSTMRGETDAIIVTVPSAVKYINNQNLVPLVVFDENRSKELLNVPTIFELTNLNEEQKWLLDFRLNLSKLGKTLAIVPNAPKENVEYLSSVIEKIVTNKDVISQANKEGLEIDFQNKEEYKKLLDSFFITLDDEKIEKIKYILLEKYY